MLTARLRLRHAASSIADRRGEPPASPWKAFRKLFIAERRDWAQPNAPRVGWKRGELWEVIAALLHRDRQELAEEWGDVGYYIAQTWQPLWWLYAAVTPDTILQATVKKFEQRSKR